MFVGKQFGLTDGINPKDYNRPLQQVLTEMTDGGVDYAFECVGNVETMVRLIKHLIVNVIMLDNSVKYSTYCRAFVYY